MHANGQRRPHTFETRDAGRLTAISCAPLLTTCSVAALWCSEITASRLGLTGFAL